MPYPTCCPRPVLHALALALAGCLLTPLASLAGEFAVSPIRAELKAGALTETLTVTNYADAPLRVSAKLMEWTQDATGADVYKESGDLVYFPRQLDIPPQGRRLIRVGAKSTGPASERTYRLYIEEEPAPGSTAGAQVNFYFRFVLSPLPSSPPPPPR
jgi:fimbrial chaperone protein